MRVTIILACLALLVPSFLVGQEEGRNSDKLLPIREDGKWGYINLAAESVIVPRFDQAWEFVDGLARVSVDGAIGFINPTGEIVIEPRYTAAWDFSYERAVVRLDDGKLAIIDKHGRIIFRLKKDCTWAPTNKTGHSDCLGGQIMQLEHFLRNPSGLHGFYEGLLAVKVGDKTGFVDTDGDFVIEPQFMMVSLFSEGLAQFIKWGGQHGYIDRSGRIAITAKKFRGQGFSEGLAVATRRGYGYIDKTGKFVIKPRFVNACVFSNGLAKVVTKRQSVLGWLLSEGGDDPLVKRWGYINKQGEMVFEVRAKEAPFDWLDCASGMFTEGLAVAKTGGQYGYIDKNFGYVIPPQFDKAKAFRDGVAWVKIGEEFGYIDKAGRFIWRSDDKN